MKAPVIHAVSVITRSLWVRFHMMLILLVVLLAGIGSSFILLKIGVHSIPVRYVLAVLLGYALFLLGVRLWLWYVQKTLPHLQREVVEVVDGRRRPSMPPEHGGSDGRGLDDLGTVADVLGVASGDGCVIVAVVVLIVAALGGMVTYVLAVTPELLGEAVVQVALAAALRRRSRRWDSDHWSGSVFRGTWGIVLIAMFAAVIIGVVIQAECPSTMTLFEAMSNCQ